MVAVGFNPRVDREMGGRRGATIERLIVRPRADSSVATRRGSASAPVRGLKPTATVMCRSAALSLCDTVEWASAVGIGDVFSDDRGLRLSSAKDILLLVINLVSVEERAVFFLERFHAMMFALSANVLLDLRDLGFADRERRIAILPRKPAHTLECFLHPTRRTTFDELQCLADR